MSPTCNQQPNGASGTQHKYPHTTRSAKHLEASLAAAESKAEALQQQVTALELANRALEGQAATDQASRKRADDTRTWADAERSRLQRARDELALKVKVARPDMPTLGAPCACTDAGAAGG